MQYWRKSHTQKQENNSRYETNWAVRNCSPTITGEMDFDKFVYTSLRKRGRRENETIETNISHQRKRRRDMAKEETMNKNLKVNCFSRVWEI